MIPRSILLFDRSLENSKILIQSIKATSNTWFLDTDFQCHEPDEVFSHPMLVMACVVFFTLSNMYDAEAARKFNALHKNIPLVVVSDSEEYSILSLELGTCYYLIRPICKVKLQIALKKAFKMCSENNPHRQDN